MEKNYRYDSKSWEIDIMAKRIIAWTSNSKLTYEDGNTNYKNKFNVLIKKQINQPDIIFAQPEDIADEIYHIAQQERSAWSFDVEVRPDIEQW